MASKSLLYKNCLLIFSYLGQFSSRKIWNRKPEHFNFYENLYRWTRSLVIRVYYFDSYILHSRIINMDLLTRTKNFCLQVLYGENFTNLPSISLNENVSPSTNNTTLSSIKSTCNKDISKWNYLKRIELGYMNILSSEIYDHCNSD